MRKPKFNHDVHKDPLLVDTLSQLKQSTLFQLTAWGFCFNIALIIQAWLLLEVFPSSKVYEVRNLRRALERQSNLHVFQYSQENSSSLVLQSGATLFIFAKLDSTPPSYSLFFFLFVTSDKYNANILDKYFFLDLLEELVYYLSLYLFTYLYISNYFFPEYCNIVFY